MRKSAFVITWLMLCSLALGAAWTTKRLSNSTGNSHYPSLAATDSAVYAVWADDTSGNHEVYFRKSITAGTTWQIAQKLTDNKGESHNPAIAVNGSNVFIAWEDDTPGNIEIYFKKSADGGATWQTAKRLTYNSGESFVPRIAISGASIFLVWQDPTPGNYEIYFKKSADGGATWQSARRLTNNSGYSGFPKIAVNSSSVFVVWSDETPGNSVIYLKYSHLQ